MKSLKELVEESRLQDLAVPLRKGETYQGRDRIDEILEFHWKGNGAWLRDSQDHDAIQFTYGEVTPFGVRQMIHFFGLETLWEDDEEDSNIHREPIVFYDLGSGAGKLVIQMFLENVTSIAIGVELCKPRHVMAVKAWEDLQGACGLSDEDTICRIPLLEEAGQEKLVDKDRVQLWNQDIVDADFSNATHIYLSSLCFPIDLADHVANIIMDNHRRHGKLKVVIALSALKPFETEENQQLWKKTIQLLHMTWGFSSAKVYTYVGPPS
ncbi:Histone methylation protein DOT1 [Seminavis robusta]|uniref:Histone methylation protein DOT1 n=1 Tax=Seminavis robusta TaxID=568900 RepID=A0A9N8ET52_9STRA|nr:Histone methylation protein DOT1 [Seminavis robusta]|eukprot:Sro1802_g298530.1 Histone methylation protein DOT1 (267) ;mRNA; f:4635-5435